MNAVVVFVALLFFGMSGAPGAFCWRSRSWATIKMVFGEIEHLKPVAVLMGD
jgi:hypothetical protein